MEEAFSERDQFLLRQAASISFLCRASVLWRGLRAVRPSQHWAEFWGPALVSWPVPISLRGERTVPNRPLRGEHHLEVCSSHTELPLVRQPACASQETLREILQATETLIESLRRHTAFSSGGIETLGWGWQEPKQVFISSDFIPFVHIISPFRGKRAHLGEGDTKIWEIQLSRPIHLAHPQYSTFYQHGRRSVKRRTVGVALCEDPLLGGSVALTGSSKPVQAEVRWSRLPPPQPCCSPSGFRMAAEELKKESPFRVWSSVTHHPHATSQSQGLIYLWIMQVPCFCAHSLFLPVSSSFLCSLTGSQRAGYEGSEESSSNQGPLWLVLQVCFRGILHPDLLSWVSDKSFLLIDVSEGDGYFHSQLLFLHWPAMS